MGGPEAKNPKAPVRKAKTTIKQTPTKSLIKLDEKSTKLKIYIKLRDILQTTVHLHPIKRH